MFEFQENSIISSWNFGDTMKTSESEARTRTTSNAGPLNSGHQDRDTLTSRDVAIIATEFHRGHKLSNLQHEMGK